MIPTAAFPVNTLTPDQAASELEQLLDLRFWAEQDPVKLHHWKTEHAQRVTDLQMWLMLHPVQEAPAAAEPETEDAPPQHLETPSMDDRPKEDPKKEHFPTNKLTPAQKLANYLTQYAEALALVVADPSNRTLRNRASVIRSHVKTHCASYKLKVPDMEALPALPDPKPHTSSQKRPPSRCVAEPARKEYGTNPIDQVLDTVHAALAGVEVVLDPTMPNDQVRFDLVGQEVGRIVNVGKVVTVGEIKASANHPADFTPEPQEKTGPGPYREPTTQDLRDALAGIDPTGSYEEVLAQLDAMPPRAVAGTVDLVEESPNPLQVRANIRRIRHDLMALLLELDRMGSRERRLMEEDMRSLDNLMDTAVIVTGEPDIPKAV